MSNERPKPKLLPDPLKYDWDNLTLDWVCLRYPMYAHLPRQEAFERALDDIERHGLRPERRQ